MSLLFPLLLGGCGGSVDSGPIDTGPLPRCETPGPLDDTLRLHQVQALATHNSYHLEPEAVVDDSQRYSHAPLTVQLAEQGVRGFELDLHLREGAGFEVFHVPVADEGTTCRALTDCLSELRAWSRDHPCHLPLVIWLEPKDDIDALVDGLLPLAGHWQELEQAILSTWPAERILTPDEVRGDAETLAEAVQDHGLPPLGELRGQAIFALLDSGAHRDEYLEGTPAAEGRLLFPDAEDPDDPAAAMLKINDAGSAADRVAAYAALGFVITSNVDGAEQDDAANAERLSGAVAAGAHYLATDFPAAVSGREYVAVVPGGAPAACNPVTAPADCTASAVEDLGAR